MLPSKSVGSKNETVASPGFKKSKHRIILLFCINTTGIHNLLLILFGKSAKSRAFKNVNMKSLPLYYHSLMTAWMNQELFKKVISFSVCSISHKTFTIKKIASKITSSRQCTISSKWKWIKKCKNGNLSFTKCVCVCIKSLV